MILRWTPPRPLRTLIHRIGFRGYFLLTLAVVDVFQGLNFVQPGNPGQAQTNRYVGAAVPFDNPDTANWTWALAWWVVAAFCVYNAFKTTRDHWAFLMAIFIKVAYVTAMVYGSMHGMIDGPRRIVVWAWFASTVWVMSRLPEPPWTLIDLNEEIEDSIEILRRDQGGEDA